MVTCRKLLKFSKNEGVRVIRRRLVKRPGMCRGSQCGHCLGGLEEENMQSNEPEGYLSVLKVRVLKGRKSRVAGKYQYPGEF